MSELPLPSKKSSFKGLIVGSICWWKQDGQTDACKHCGFKHRCPYDVRGARAVENREGD